MHSTGRGQSGWERDAGPSLGRGLRKAGPCIWGGDIWLKVTAPPPKKKKNELGGSAAGAPGGVGVQGAGGGALVASRRATEVTLSPIIVSVASKWHEDAMAEAQRLVYSWFGVYCRPKEAQGGTANSPAGFRD
jgi:hypothetical protein